jgi:hypothetical protein
MLSLKQFYEFEFQADFKFVFVLLEIATQSLVDLLLFVDSVVDN